jgi:hypothetical protein
VRPFDWRVFPPELVHADRFSEPRAERCGIFHFWRGAGQPEHGGVRPVGENGEVLPEVEAIMRMAADKRVGIGFGHTDFPELLPLARKAKELGVRAVLDHPLLELNKLLLSEMEQLADLGVYVGTYRQPMIPSLYQPIQNLFETIRTIQAIGPERCIIGSDFGQVLHVNSIDGMRIFVRGLLGFGIKPDDVKKMLQDNPGKLMYLDDDPEECVPTTRGYGNSVRRGEIIWDANSEN